MNNKVIVFTGRNGSAGFPGKDGLPGIPADIRQKDRYRGQVGYPGPK